MEVKTEGGKKSRFSGGLEAWRKAHAQSATKKAEALGNAEIKQEEVLAPNKVEIPGFPKAMKGVSVFKPEKPADLDEDGIEVGDKFDLAKLAKDMMDRRKRVERFSSHIKCL